MFKNEAKVIILDRDGIINHDSLNYIRSPEEYIFLPKSIEAIARLTAAQYKIGIATNQSGIARGYYSHATLSAIHAKMLDGIKSAGGTIDFIEYCPHFPTAGCKCRKPEPGMLLSLASKFKVLPQDIIFIGDKGTDVKAAMSIGATPFLVYSSMTHAEDLVAYPDLLKFTSLYDCVDYLLQE